MSLFGEDPGRKEGGFLPASQSERGQKLQLLTDNDLSPLPPSDPSVRCRFEIMMQMMRRPLQGDEFGIRIIQHLAESKLET